MRSAAWLTGLAVLVGLSGCGGDRRVETAQARPPARDLTQPSEPVAVTVASPVELGRTQARSSRAHPNRPSHKPTRVRMDPPAPAAAPTPEPLLTVIPAVMKPISSPKTSSEAPERGIGHELAPGETVTIIPASTGQATGPGAGVEGHERHAGGGVFIGGGHGGSCRPRGGVRGFRHSI
jgi:hypothetical protein